MQGFARDSFLGLFLEVEKRAKLALITHSGGFSSSARDSLDELPTQAASRAARAALHVRGFQSPSRLSLDDEDVCFLGRWSSDGLDFLHTGCAKGIKTNAILGRNEMFTQFGLQEKKLPAAQKTLE